MFCLVALVLLLDASGSIRDPDWETQVFGHAAALEAPQLTRAGPLAVTALAFSDGTTPLLTWRVLRTSEDAARAAQELRQAVRPYPGGTNIGGALQAGLRALEQAPCEPDQEVLDLVTDGEAAEEPTQLARDAAVERGTRINALGVGSPDAATWLREHAVTPGGFVLQVNTWEQFSDAIRRKVTSEVAQERLETITDLDYAGLDSNRGSDARRYPHD